MQVLGIKIKLQTATKEVNQELLHLCTRNSKLEGVNERPCYLPSCG